MNNDNLDKYQQKNDGNGKTPERSHISSQQNERSEQHASLNIHIQVRLLDGRQIDVPLGQNALENSLSDLRNIISNLIGGKFNSIISRVVCNML